MNNAPPNRNVRPGERGLSFVELMITVTILTIIASAAYPVARFQVKRENERILRYDLWMMRDAIDHYKDAADKNAFQVKIDTQGYPPDLETLVNGVEVQTKKVKFLRRIPVFDAGRSKFIFIRRAKRLRRLLQIDGNGAGWNQVF
jgi:prepilin-type N-terminal cleavage/methylation domain-containing protein